MITRELKLKLTKKQELILAAWLWQLAGVYNWAIRKIELDARDKIYYSKWDFQNLLAEHGRKMEMPSHTLNEVLVQAWLSWDKCFKKITKKPKFKSVRNKMNSIPFPDPIPQSRWTKGKIRMPIIGGLRFHKQALPVGKIKNSRIIRKASGWYLQITIDAQHTFKVVETEKRIGIDTGFKNLATLSNGVVYANQRNFSKGQERLAQAQRGNCKKLIAKLQEKNANRRKDYNHKVSKEIVKNYKEIYITNDNLKGQKKLFGKSVTDAGISQLRKFISYKSGNHGRKFVLVDSKNTTLTCSICGALTGPKGLDGLAVRSWVCGTCGVFHDRDKNSAVNVLNFGLGCSLETLKSLGGAV